MHHDLKKEKLLSDLSIRANFDRYVSVGKGFYLKRVKKKHLHAKYAKELHIRPHFSSFSGKHYLRRLMARVFVWKKLFTSFSKKSVGFKANWGAHSDCWEPVHWWFWNNINNALTRTDNFSPEVLFYRLYTYKEWNFQVLKLFSKILSEIMASLEARIQMKQF